MQSPSPQNEKATSLDIASIFTQYLNTLQVSQSDSTHLVTDAQEILTHAHQAVTTAEQHDTEGFHLHAENITDQLEARNENASKKAGTGSTQRANGHFEAWLALVGDEGVGGTVVSNDDEVSAGRKSMVDETPTSQQLEQLEKLEEEKCRRQVCAWW